MRILLYTENYLRGGVDTFIATLVNHWPEADDEFTLLCNEDYPGLAVIRGRLEKPCRVMTHKIPTYARFAERTRGKKVLDTLRLCSSPLSRYLFLAATVRVLRPLLAEAACDRLMVVNGGYPGADSCRAAGIAWGLYSGKPASIHNFHNLASSPSRVARLQEDAVDALLVRHTKAFVTVSRAAAASLEVRPKLHRAGKTLFIYNGIDAPAPLPTQRAMREELGIPFEAPVCIILGSYEPRKGHLFLLQVFRRVLDRMPKAHLVACGHGNDFEIESIRRAAQGLGVHANVHLFNFRSDAMQLLAQADILLVGSQEFESFGLTCIEAMARRIPVVTTNVGGLPEVVIDGEGGFCTGKDDVNGFAEHVLRLLIDEKLRKVQGEKGFKRYESTFSADRMARDYANLICDNKDT